jgi:thiol-disulfide isomerase/thioredoxin
VALRDNRRMRIDASQLYGLLGCATVALLPGMALVHLARGRAARILGWLLFAAGFAGIALLALLQFAGRLGLENLWFRSPAFYIATALSAAAGVWWLRQPTPARLRFGLPAVLLGLTGLAALALRLDGHSTPLAMLMPTMDAVAPELSYIDSNGATRRLSELRGRVVMLFFWATWCTPCRRDMPLLSQLQREHADDGLVVLYVSLEEPEVLAPFLAEHRFDGIQGRLDHAAPFYDAGKFYPLSYLISRDGRVRERWSGRPTEQWLATQVRAAL